MSELGKDARKVLEETPLAIFVTSVDGRILGANRACLDLLGLRPETFSEHAAADFYADPADRERLRRAVEREGRVTARDVRMVTAGGEPFDARVDSTGRFDESGELVGFTGFIRDVTEELRVRRALEHVEYRYRSLVDHNLFAVFSVDLEGTITELNPAVEELVGWSREELVGSSFWPLIPDDWRERTQEVFGGAATGEAQTAELEVFHRDGHRVRIEAVSMPLVVEGEIVGLHGMARDVTDARRLEERLRRAQRMEAVGRLAGGLAHDFNNLLTAIRGHVDLALEDLPDAHPAREDLGQIAVNADRAATLIRQLLAFSRQQMLRTERLDLGDVVEETSTLIRRVVGEDVALDVAIPGATSPVEADRAQMEQVVLDLALNARDAMPRGGSLEIRLGEVVVQPSEADARAFHLPSGPYVRLTVRDSGAGMDPGTADRIFEPFFTTKEQGRGTGLGLSTVYGIVKQSGGFIDVETKPGGGTTFEILLPPAGPGPGE